MRKRPRNILGKLATTVRTHAQQARHGLTKNERGRKIFQPISLFILAGVFAFANVVPVLAAQTAANQGPQLDAEAKAIERMIDQAPGHELRDKKDVKRAFGDATSREWYQFGPWHSKHWTSCHTVKKLTKLLDLLERLRERHPSSTLEELYTRIYMLRMEILMSMPADKRCEGFEDINAEPSVQVKSSDNQQLAMSVDFGLPTLTTVKANNQTFTRVHQQGLENMVGAPGEPAIPQWRKLVALPQGSTPRLKLSQPQLGDQLNMNLVPFQEQAVDQTAPDLGDGDTPPEPSMDTFADKPFKINEQTYRTDRTLPPNPCKITPMGQYRDVQIAQLECTTAQYNPVNDRFTMLRGLEVEIAFEGGEGKFITNRTFSPFESNAKLTTEAVVNKDVLSKYVHDLDLSALGCQGEEFLILTHANFREAADRLAQHKRDRGLSTRVFNVGNTVPSRDTAEEIDDFIEDRYDDCKVRPSYVMLLGDAEFIPTFYPAGMADNAGSDFPYSNYVQILFDAFFPDFGVGRVPVDTLAQADTVVDKIVNYESDPPNLGLGNGAPFYTTAGFASQFQCCRMNANGTPANNQPGTDQRAFIETSEFARQELIDRGYTVPRLYTRTVDDGGYCIQENASGDCVQTQAAYNGDATPRRYFNGTLIPSAIGPGSGFAWNADTADVSDAWNDGRFLFLHRDHGWPGGWGDPGFSSANVDALSNDDRLPVVWSVNCASGMFDNETAGGTYNTTMNGVYFAERALRKADGGAIGVIGDTRNSPTWANNALTRGFFDAVWPNTLPAHGGNTAHKRLGDTLNWGKVYLASQVGVEQTAGSVTVDQMGYEYHIWHVIGDPTLEMWTKNPRKLTLSNNFKAEITRIGERISYDTDGATITKLQVTDEGETQAIGRAVVKDGVAEMEYFQQPNPQLKSIYAATLDDAVSVRLEHTDTPPRVD